MDIAGCTWDVALLALWTSQADLETFQNILKILKMCILPAFAIVFFHLVHEV
jgi:hypothetical protein